MKKKELEIKYRELLNLYNQLLSYNKHNKDFLDETLYFHINNFNSTFKKYFYAFIISIYWFYKI